MTTKPHRKKKTEPDTFAVRAIPFLRSLASDEILRDAGVNGPLDVLPRIERLLVEIRDELRAGRRRKSRR